MSYSRILVCTLIACGSNPTSQEAPEATESREPHEEGTPPAEARPPGSFDLLPAVATRIAVSTTTPSLASGPRFLVDGNPETAWASRTGDDHASIAFELPAGVRLERIELTAGFTQVVDGHDRFTENLRITEVVVHHGERSFTARLDPENRGLQSVEVEGGEGIWRIDIERTIPGTRPGYREVCVSELRAMGTASLEASDGSPARRQSRPG